MTRETPRASSGQRIPPPPAPLHSRSEKYSAFRCSIEAVEPHTRAKSQMDQSRLEGLFPSWFDQQACLSLDSQDATHLGHSLYRSLPAIPDLCSELSCPNRLQRRTRNPQAVGTRLAWTLQKNHAERIKEVSCPAFFDVRLLTRKAQHSYQAHSSLKNHFPNDPQATVRGDSSSGSAPIYLCSELPRPFRALTSIPPKKGPVQCTATNIPETALY